MRTRTHVNPEITEDMSGDIWRSPALYIFEEGGCNLNKMSDELLSKGNVALGEQLSVYYRTY